MFVGAMNHRHLPAVHPRRHLDHAHGLARVRDDVALRGADLVVGVLADRGTGT
jgi:hypothetical protein